MFDQIKIVEFSGHPFPEIWTFFLDLLSLWTYNEIETSSSSCGGICLLKSWCQIFHGYALQEEQSLVVDQSNLDKDSIICFKSYLQKIRTIIEKVTLLESQPMDDYHTLIELYC